MGNKRLIYLFAFSLSIVFSIGYYIVFRAGESMETKSTTLYFNQVGLFEKQEGADAKIAALQAIKVDGIIRKQGKVLAVVCGMSTNKNDTIKNQKLLEKNQFSFVFKEVKTNQKSIVDAINHKDYAEAFERIENESKGTESK